MGASFVAMIKLGWKIRHVIRDATTNLLCEVKRLICIIIRRACMLVYVPKGLFITGGL